MLVKEFMASNTDYITIPMVQNKPLKLSSNKYLERVHLYLDPLTKLPEKGFRTLESQSCLRLTCAVTAPFIILAVIISCLIIYVERPIYTKDIYVEGYVDPNPAICPNEGKGIKLAIFVSSSAENYETRVAVRHTWGSFANRTDVIVAFVLGQSLNMPSEAVEMEQNIYKDLIITKSLDTYPNLSLKSIAILKWAQEYCSQTKFVMKADDDTFVNVPAWLAFTDLRKSEIARTIWSYEINYCSYPVRDTSSKYFVQKKQFSRDFYPIHVSGSNYMMSFECARPLIEAALEAVYVNLEGVFLTGVIAERVGIARRLAYPLTESEVSKTFAFHNVLPSEQYLMWKTYKMTGRVLTIKEIFAINPVYARISSMHSKLDEKIEKN